MSRFGYVLAFGLALATAYAASQENPNPTQQGTPATTVQQQPHPAQPPTQDAAPPASATTNQSPTPATSATGTSAATGSAQNTAAANKQAQTAKPANTSKANAGGFFSNPQDTARLQEQIQNAIRNEPTLSGDTVTVSVTDSEIDVGGNVSTSKDRVTARRIAQSFAGNRSVREHISVAGVAPAATSATERTGKNSAATKTDTRQANKPVAEPEQKGDASEKPR